jgi:beta-lactamase class A
MQRRLPIFTLAILLLAAAPIRAAVPGVAGLPDSLRARIDARLAGAGLSAWGVAYRDLATGQELLMHPDSSFHAASTMKVPVMARLFRMAERGRLSLADSLRVTNRFRSIYDSSVYRLSPEEDSDTTLYRRVGERVPVRELIHRMIARSSNLATNELIRLADPDSIETMLAGIGAGGLQVLRGVQDIPAFRHGMSNRTTARALMELLSALARGELAGPEATREMTDILEAQHFNDGIPAGLPDSVAVAHKTGWITGIVHDAAVVTPSPGAEPYVLVVLTRGEVEPARARRSVADVSRMIWEARRGS